VAAADQGGLGLVQGASVAAVWLTSTYLEGEQNAFAAFGYKCDRTSGIGLLPDADGRQLSVELFAGHDQGAATRRTGRR